MTADEVKRELRYQFAMYIAYRMLRSRVISRKDYTIIDTKMSQVYSPIIGELFSRI